MKRAVIQLKKGNQKKRMIILKLMKNLFCWIKNSKKKEDRFGKTRIDLGLISKQLRLREGKSRQKRNKENQNKLLKRKILLKLSKILLLVKKSMKMN